MISRLAMHSTEVHPDPVEAEFAKDIWDVRKIPGVRYSAHRSDHLLNFTKVPQPFRALTKRYIQLLLIRRSHVFCDIVLRWLRFFLDFYVPRYPTVGDFLQLSRSDIEAYLLHVHLKEGIDGKPLSAKYLWEGVHTVRHFLEYLERISSPDAPLTPVSKLIWVDELGSAPQPSRPKIKYIAEQVLAQLEEQIEKLPAVYLPVVIVLRASGWRISDVLNLRYDTCLARSSSGWGLQGDILKTDILDHRVPLSDEIAALVTAQSSLIREKFTLQENPQRYLFPAITQKRAGRPLTGRSVQDALNRLAVTYEIKGEAGHIFHFGTHAFRHSKAVELINAGMSKAHVQKWLAHLSPEMTLVYARILDTTMRKEWEQAFAKGAVRIDVQGHPQGVTAEHLGNEQEIEWEHIRSNLDAVRLADGYCFKPKKAHCPTQDSPCYTCRHFCTTPDFLPQFEKQERELHELIELGERAGSEIWVERNTQKLNRVLPLIQVLRKGDLHHPAGKAIREYTPAERAKRA